MYKILKTIALVATIAITSTAGATSTTNTLEQYFDNANAAYDSGDYQQAADIYSKILHDGFASWELYYNLGNTYYRMDQMGYAILNYERALRLAPNKQVIKDNLQLASSKTVDNIEPLPRMFLVQWLHSIARLTSPRGWRTLLIVFLTLTAASACIFFIAKQYRTRRTLFVTGVLMLFFTIIFIFFAAFSAKISTNNTEAVVVDPMIVVKSSPDAKSVDKFIIHEGTLLNITDQQDDWWQITIADGKSGWINSGAERVNV